MKLNTLRIIALVFCFLMVSDMCSAFEKRHRSSRRFHRRSHVSYHQNQLNIKNKWVKLAEGVMSGLTQGNTAWVQCLPQKWTTQVEEAPQEQSYVDSKFEGMSGAGKAILSFIGQVIDGICKFQGAIMKIFEVLFAPGAKSFMEGRFGLRRIRTRRGFFNWIKNTAKSVAGTVVGAVKRTASAVANGVKAVGKGIVSAASWVGDRVKDAWNAISAFAQGVLTKIKDFVVRLKDSIVGFFKSETFQNIINLFKCIPTIREAANSVKDIILGLKDKFASLFSGALTLPAIVKLIIGLLCKKDDFISAINDFGAASAQGDVLQKFFLRGRGIGKILHAVATARRRRY